MRYWSAVGGRYVRDPLVVRLGELTANLARVKSFSDHPMHAAAVESPLKEGKCFIEWSAPEADVETQAVLIDLQIQLALWQLNWSRIWPDSFQRAMVANQAQVWSDRVLAMSGLID